MKLFVVNFDFGCSRDLAKALETLVSAQGLTVCKRIEISGHGAIVRIQNKDDLCLAWAIIVAKAKVDNDTRYTQIKDLGGDPASKTCLQFTRESQCSFRAMRYRRSQEISILFNRLSN